MEHTHYGKWHLKKVGPELDERGKPLSFIPHYFLHFFFV
jgi:hypothetical protein